MTRSAVKGSDVWSKKSRLRPLGFQYSVSKRAQRSSRSETRRSLPKTEFPATCGSNFALSLATTHVRLKLQNGRIGRCQAGFRVHQGINSPPFCILRLAFVAFLVLPPPPTSRRFFENTTPPKMKLFTSTSLVILVGLFALTMVRATPSARSMSLRQTVSTSSH